MSVEWAKLGDVVEVIRGASPRPKGDPRYFGGNIPWVRISDITKEPGKYLSKTRDGVTPAGAEKSRLLSAGTLILSNSGTVCVPKILAVEGCIHDGFVAFPNLPPSIDKIYLYHYFNFIRPRIIQENKQGITQVNLNTGIVKDIDFPLRPTEEQRLVVAEIEKQLSRLDEAVASLKRIQANLKRYKAAVLKAAVEGKLTEQWRKDHPDVEPADQLLKRILAKRRAKWEAVDLAKMKAKGIKPKDDSWRKRYKEPAEPDKANLPDSLKEWVWARTDQLFSFVTSGSRGWASYYSETGPIFLRMGNLDHDTIKLDLSDVQRVQPPDGAEGLRTRVVAGDILISITADVGMVGMVPDGFEEAYINQHVSLARPLSTVNSTFLAWFLACKTGQDQFKELQRGATKVGLGLDDIKSVIVPLPPIEEQKTILAEIDSRLSVTEELEATIVTNLMRAERMRQTILKEAFSGRL